jgi:O-antigen/teichoic acid export membrane protein
MSKAADMAKISAKGGFNLLWGLVISTVISAIGTIFIARLLGSNLYGLYTVVFIVPNLIATFRDWGVNSAIIRYVAQYRAEGRYDEIRSIFISGLIFEVVLGLALSIICFALSSFIGVTVFNRPAIVPLLRIASFIMVAGGLANAATAAFTGVEKMELNSIMIICQSIIKTLVIIGLVVAGLGPLGATVGYTTAYAASGVIGVILMWSLYRNLPKSYSKSLEIRAYINVMLQYGVPLSLSNIVGGFMTQFWAFLLPIYYATNNILIGNYGVAANFVILITFFATPVTTMLFPAFSKLDAKKDKETLQNVYQFSVKYASLLVVPVAALIMCLSGPAVSTLFGNTYSYAPLFLALLSISYLYPVFGSLSTSNLITGQGQTTFILYLNLLTAAIGFPLGYVLIMSFGVLGLIVASITAGVPSMFISLSWIKKRYGVALDWTSTARILFSSGVTGALTYIIVAELGFSSWIRLILGVIVFAFILVPVVVLTRTINRSDIANIRSMFSSLGPIGGLVNKILSLFEKLMGTARTS